MCLRFVPCEDSMVGFFRAIHALTPLRAPGVPKKVEPQKNCDSDYSYGTICHNCAVCTKDQTKSNEIKMTSNINSFYASICINSTQLRAKPSPIQCARRCPAKRQRISKTLMKYDQIDFKQIKHLVYSLYIYNYIYIYIYIYIYRYIYRDIDRCRYTLRKW